MKIIVSDFVVLKNLVSIEKNLRIFEKNLIDFEVWGASS